MCPECEVKVKNPAEGQSYTSTGGATYVYQAQGGWTEQGGQLAEVKVTPTSYAQGPYADAPSGTGKVEAGLYRTGFNSEGEDGQASGSLTGYSGEAHFNEKDGAGASASLLKADVKGQYGSDNNNINGAAGGKLLSADANINAQSSYQGGVLKIGTDIHAGASVAEGELKGGGAVGGFGGTFKISGDVASAHAGGGANVTVDTNKHIATFSVSGDIGLGLGLGAKMTIQIPLPSF